MQVHDNSTPQVIVGAVATYCTTLESYWRQTLVSSLREITATLHLNLPLGVTNEGREAIKLISGAVAGDSKEVQVRES